MNSEKTKIVNVELPGIQNLGLIRASIEELGNGWVKLTIKSDGKVWSKVTFGTQDTLVNFWLKRSTDSIAKWLGVFPSVESDFKAVKNEINKRILSNRKDGRLSSKAARVLFDVKDWSVYAPVCLFDEWKTPNQSLIKNNQLKNVLEGVDIPRKESTEYLLLCDIIELVKTKLEQILWTKVPIKFVSRSRHYMENVREKFYSQIKRFPSSAERANLIRRMTNHPEGEKYTTVKCLDEWCHMEFYTTRLKHPTETVTCPVCNTLHHLASVDSENWFLTLTEKS